jgi:hypothetical protein
MIDCCDTMELIGSPQLAACTSPNLRKLKKKKRVELFR